MRGVSAVMLEERPAGGQWQPVAAVAGGSVHVTEKPTSTTDYRLATPSAAAGSVRIRVAPAVTVTSFTASEVTGSVAPVLPAARVQVQQQASDLTTWTIVATGAVAGDGTFAIPVQLASGGTYRVAVVPTAGYATGTTTPQIVVR